MSFILSPSNTFYGGGEMSIECDSGTSILELGLQSRRDNPHDNKS